MSKLAGYEAAGLINAGGWSGPNWQIAVAIAKAESGWDPKATHKNNNGSTDYGLMQINSIHNPTDAEKTSAIANARKGAQIFTAAGSKFTPWATYNSGSYKKYMGDAANGIKAWQATAADAKSMIIKADGGIPDPAPHAAVTDTTGAIAGVANAVGGFSDTLTKIASNVGIIIVAVVLLSLGVFVLTRQQSVKLAKTAAKVAL